MPPKKLPEPRVTAIPLTCLVGTGDVGAVVVVVVVVLSVRTGGSLVVDGGANVPDAAGSLVVAFNAVATCTGALLGMVDGVVPTALGSVPVPSLVFVGGFGEPLDDDVDVADGAVVDAGAVDMPEAGAP